MVFIIALVDGIAWWIDKRFDTNLRKPKVTVEDVKHLLEANLPFGSSIEEIFHFLEAQNIVHSGNISDYDDRYEEGLRLRQELPQQPELVRKMIVGWILNVGREWLVRWDIRIIFYLDEQNRLIECTVKTIGTGL